ncbi:MAG: site-2 protease family protein [Desulfovibrionaceae bacterium]|nr:site-2 protease family protein [Desulfovibrionaceae bacterium]
MFASLDVAAAVQRAAVAFVPMLLGIILHEVAHGWAACKLGDPTAKQLGRLTWNPLPHIDPLGLICFFLTSLTGSFIFGWAKPVPINPLRFRNTARDMMLTSFAGPATNFLLAILFALILRVMLAVFPFASYGGSSAWNFGLNMLLAGISVNFTLAWFNLLPIPPLDGSRILWGILPPKLAFPYMRFERYGFIVLLLLLASGILNFILFPLVRFSFDMAVTLLVQP